MFANIVKLLLSPSTASLNVRGPTSEHFWKILGIMLFPALDGRHELDSLLPKAFCADRLPSSEQRAIPTSGSLHERGLEEISMRRLFVPKAP